ncbi:MAG: helix-turn-helix domain-containing protein [Oscillatoriaceae cyanobacterium Prado104]|jgi:transposase|nr:helix-turn-helix domain-containing protein [Oscillatoriaceae cyanobacterium Prado104]
MYRGYKFRIYANTEQQIALAKSFGCTRWFGNYSLSLCQETYRATGKGLSRKVIQGLLPGLKKEYRWFTDAYSQCWQVVAFNLSNAYRTSEHSRYDNPKHFAKHQRNRSLKQQKLVRKKPGSNCRHQAKKQVAKVPSKIARCHSDFLQTSRQKQLLKYKFLDGLLLTVN